TTAFGQRPSEGLAVFGQRLSCATCHSGQGFADGRSHLIGPVANRPLALRQTPHLLRIKDSAPFGWDRRNPTIEVQTRGAIVSALEMNASREPTARELFALGSFVETLDAPDAVPGVDFDPVKAELGKRLFNEERGTDPSGEFPVDQKISCATCHSGPLLTDRKSHRILFAFGDPIDPGEIGSKGEMIGFKTPVLRGLRFTAPYVHDGLAGDGGLGVRIPGVSEARNSLRNAVVSFYNNRFLFQFTNEELDALTEFLLSL
ncbi:MAG: cytochrome c peroxidase, partial [Acidimicrobiia bacterium]